MHTNQISHFGSVRQLAHIVQINILNKCNTTVYHNRLQTCFFINQILVHTMKLRDNIQR